MAATRLARKFSDFEYLRDIGVEGVRERSRIADA